MRSSRSLLAALTASLILPLTLAQAAAPAADAAPAPVSVPPLAAAKRVLLVTHSGGFIHSSVVTAEAVLKEVGRKHNFEVVCFRYTGDPAGLEAYSKRFQGSTRQPVTPEQTGRLNAETLAKFDAVLFFTTGEPVINRDEQTALLDFVLKGKAFLGTHCATDTLYKFKEYGEMIGGYFNGHPWHTKVNVVIEDTNHPTMKPWGSAQFEITDEIYQFRDPYDRGKLRILARLDPAWLEAESVKRTAANQKARETLDETVKKMEANVAAEQEKIRKSAQEKAAKLTADGKADEAKKLLEKAEKDAADAAKKPAKYREQVLGYKPSNGGARPDGDYAICWCRQFGEGRVWYTALGHRDEVWKDARFQAMLVEALRWSTKQVDGDATPSGATKVEK